MTSISIRVDTADQAGEARRRRGGDGGGAAAGRDYGGTARAGGHGMRQ